MARIGESIEIRAPPKRIWHLLFWDRIPEWLEIIKKVEYNSNNRAGVGVTAHVIGETEGIRVEWNVEITECIKNKELIWRSVAGDITAVGLTTLNPTETGTKVTFVIDYDLPSSILGKIIDKIKVSKEINKEFMRGLDKLKKILEK